MRAKADLTMDPLQRNEVGKTGVLVTQLGFGGGPLGDPTDVIPEDQAQATLAAAYDRGVRYFDTAPWYGNTKSEHRLGHFLRDKPRDDFVLSTKVGRVYSRPEDVADFKANSPWAKRWLGGLPFDLRFDYTYDGIMRSYEDSLTRLGLPNVDCLAIHDLDPGHMKSEAGVAGGFRQLDAGRGFAALMELKDRGDIKAIGAGINLTGLIPRFVERFDMDYFLIASPYTLLEQTALDEDLPLCQKRNISVVLGAVFSSGILATGPVTGALYRYKEANKEVVERVQAISDICRVHNVALSAAALQFPLFHPTVATVIPGANHPGQVSSNVDGVSRKIPDALWRQLKEQGYMRSDAPTP